MNVKRKNQQQELSQRRPDGRSDKVLRPLSCELECLQNCDGSAIWKSGSTSIMAAVHGPIAPRLIQHELEQSCIVSVVIKSGNNVGTYEREWEKILSTHLSSCILKEQYPRSVISVTVQIINADGSVFGAVFHASIAALMDASIEMKYLPTVVTCCVLNQMSDADASTTGFNLERIRLDPSSDEERDAIAVLVLVFSNHAAISATRYIEDEEKELEKEERSTALLGCHTTASMKLSSKMILNCWSVAARAVPAIEAFLRLAFEQKVVRESQTLWST